MVLNTFQEPARTRKVGEEVLILTPPVNLKIQTTGDQGMVLLNEGPTHGKQWTMLVRVEIKETAI